MQEQSIQIIDNNTVQINLLHGVKRGENTVKNYTLRAPLAADLEGLSQELVNLKHTDQIQKLLHRITTPTLVRREYMSLPLDDVRAFNVALDFFSAPASLKKQMLEDLSEAGYMAAPAAASATQPE